MDDRPKLIYFPRRHPGLPAEVFPARWREHGRLGMSLPRWRNVWRYAQCDRVPASTERPTLPCDGVATVVFRSEAARLAHLADPDGGITRADEAAIFAGPVRLCAVLTRATVLAPSRASPGKVFIALRRNRSLSHDVFIDRWQAAAPARVRAVLHADEEAGLIANHTLTGENPLRLDGIDEIATNRPDEVMRAFIALMQGNLRPLVDEVLLIPTRETILHRG